MLTASEKHRDVSVKDLASNEVTCVHQADLARMTGRELKGMVAEAVGCDVSSIKLICSTGTLSDFAVLEQLVRNESPGKREIAFTLVLAPLKPLGDKKERDVYFGSKAGLCLKCRIEMAQQQHSDQVRNFHDPIPDMRDDVVRLIQSSFAEQQGGLIECAVSAAYQDSGSMMYEDKKSGASIDLSSCRLWTRVATLNVSDTLDAEKLLVGAILWRIISGWPGSLASMPGGAVPAGPVLEVLFLATATGMREGGQAQKLIEELQEVGTEMGCAAMAVAAVPVQGYGFWTKNGFQVHVPLQEGKEVPRPVAVAKSKAGPGLAEPLTELGAFLRDHMVLFTDTPLVAKVLDLGCEKQGASHIDQIKVNSSRQLKIDERVQHSETTLVDQDDVNSEIQTKTNAKAQLLRGTELSNRAGIRDAGIDDDRRTTWQSC